MFTRLVESCPYLGKHGNFMPKFGHFGQLSTTKLCYESVEEVFLLFELLF